MLDHPLDSDLHYRDRNKTTMVLAQKQTRRSRKYNTGSRNKPMQPAWVINKVAKNIHRRKDSIFNNGPRETEYLYVKE